MNYKGGVKNRRARAVARLQEQLKSGIKSFSRKNDEFSDGDVQFDNFGLPNGLLLKGKDITRIKRELEILKTRI